MEKYCYKLFSKFKEHPNVEVKILALGRSQKNLIWFLPYCALFLMINAHKFDVIYYGDLLLCGPAYLGKIFSPKTRHIVDTHGLDILYPNPLYQFYLKLFCRCFQTYICNSSVTEKTLHQRGIYKTIVINRGIEKDYSCSIPREVTRQKYNIPEDATILLTVGRLVKRKGVQWFVEKVMPELKGENIYYFVIGEGTEKESIQMAIKKNKLEEKVYLLGKVTDEILTELYANADLFIMPNIAVKNDPEGFGIVALEASCAGLIVLASKIDGIVDAVIDEKNGYLLECENATSYITKIKDYMDNINLYKNRAEQFSAYTKEHFDLDHITNNYITVFENSLLERN